MMTRSVVREPDQEHQSDLPVQRCSIPGETSKVAVKNMNTTSSPGLNGTITTRYGRAVKMVHSVKDNQSIKSPNMSKESQVTVPPVETVASADGPENDATPETGKKAKIKAEKPDDNENEIKQEPQPEIPESKENILESVNTNSGGEEQQASANGRWVVGELAWAHVKNYPYWPCIVTVDPADETHRKQKPFGKRIIKMVHVQYFGDNGRHNWVNENFLMLFEGLKQFNDMANELLKGRKKTTKFYSGFLVKTVIKKKWDTAVSEAEALFPMTIKERFRSLAPKRKRGRPRLSQESVAKKPRLSESVAQKSIDEDLEIIKASPNKSFDDPTPKDISLTTETPPTPPSSIKDSSDESSIVKKHKRRRRTKAQTNQDFENYYRMNKDNMELVPNDGTQAEIRRFLRNIWDDMSSYQRSKYKIDLPPNDLHTQEKSSFSADEELTTEDRPSKIRKFKTTKDKEKLDISIDSGKRAKLNMFKGIKAARVCQICEKQGNLTRCKGPCYSYFHLKCVKPGESDSECDIDEDTVDSASTSSGDAQKKNSKDDTTEDETFKCIDCLSGVAPACFVCNEREDDRIRCSMATCGRHYHSKCLKLWPQSHWHGGRLTCPYHMCHTCISDNPQSHQSHIPNDKLARCVRCPSAYHASPQCLPAGSQILTSTQVICPKHYIAPHPPLNAAWCFLCTRGGSLICCDTCPTSFHPECLGIDAPDDAFICEDCETGRLPLYGEVVWVKLGNYRWWPSRICYPHEVPANLAAVSHSPGEFCVMFLGTKNYYWVHRGRVFLYQEGDSCAKVSIGQKNVDKAYRQAVDEANELHQLVKTERIAAKEEEEAKKNLKPAPYVKLRVNKPVGNVKPVEVESMVACECDPNWENPCSPDSDCLNRILFSECDPTICPAGAKCNNQSFVRRTYPLMEPFYTAGRGWGLKTLEAIRSGQFVVEYVGEVIDEAEYKRRLHRKKELRSENYYFLTIDNFRTIDAEPKGNLSRFMNHSCQPNCETQKWTVNGDTRIGLFALREIDIGEELTFNYNLATEGETKKPCLCGASNCSGYIGLKAQKPQLSVVQQTKMDKAEKVKRRRKSMKMHKCWTCGLIITVEDMIECGLKACPKRYHASCIKRVDTTESRFTCSWHHCIHCDKRTSLRCLLCSTAYCQSHLEGKMIERKDKNGYLCKVHENALGDGLEGTLEETMGDASRDTIQEDALEDNAEDTLGNNLGNDANNAQEVMTDKGDEVKEKEKKKKKAEDEDEVLSIPDTKIDSDEDFDTASLLADSDSSMRDEDVIPPRVSIIEVDLSSEESDMKTEDEDVDIKPENKDIDNKPEDKDIDIKPEDEDIDGMNINKEDIVPVPVKRKRKLKSANSQATHKLHQMIAKELPS